MTEYNYYFESGSRSYVLHLSEEKNGAALKVLRENTDAQDELLLIQKSLTLISSHTGKNDDRKIHISRVIAVGSTFDIFYEDGEVSLNEEITFQDEQTNFSIRELNESHIVLLDPANNVTDICKCSVHIHYLEKFQGNIEIVCVPASQLYEVVIDFGSEASQILIHRKDSGIHTEPIEIFKECAENFFNIQNVKKNEYDQQDEDTRLFRSIFFSSNNKDDKSPSDNGDIKSIVSKPSPNDKLVSFISRRDKVGKGLRIPNIKISYLTDLHPAGLNMKNLHRGIVMRFIHEILCYISKEEGSNPHKTIAINLTLLIPNVMCQNEVSDFIKFIKENISTKFFLDQIPEGLNLAMIEVCSCSESDASFLHWINNNQATIVPNTNYLIIDMGKGTTDFSVVKVKSGTQAEGILRAGFVGAGNVISYAILDNCIRNIVGVVKSKRKIIIKELLKAEPAMLYRLEQAIEKIKRNKDNLSTSESSEMKIEDVYNCEVETVIDRIEKFTLKSDDFQIISGIINRLVLKEIAGRINTLRIDYVVLSGRAFLYKPLREGLQKYLKEIFHNIDNNKIYFCPEDAKKGCLYGPLTPIIINKFSNMVGLPKSVDVTVLKDSTVNVDEQIEKLKEHDIQSDAIKKGNLIRNIAKTINKTFKFIFPEEDSIAESFETLINNPKAESDNEQQNMSNTISDIMQKGVSIKTYGQNTRFYISGNPYVLPNGTALDATRDYDIYFDGENFYIRADKECYLLRKDSTISISSSFLFESLFPYSLQLLGENHNIPIAKSIRR